MKINKHPNKGATLVHVLRELFYGHVDLHYFTNWNSTTWGSSDDVDDGMYGLNWLINTELYNVLFFPCLAAYACTVKLLLVVADKYFYCGPITHKQLKIQQATHFFSHFVYCIHNYNADLRIDQRINCEPDPQVWSAVYPCPLQIQ